MSACYLKVPYYCKATKEGGREGPCQFNFQKPVLTFRLSKKGVHDNKELIFSDCMGIRDG
jgi:hypothetical protein